MDRNNYKNEKYLLSPVNDYSVFTGFSCCLPEDDDRDLDDFIRDDAENHLRDRMAVTYGVFFLEEEFYSMPLAFFTLHNDAITITTEGYAYKSSPAVKIGRLGVHADLQGQGIGTEILSMVKTFMCANNRTGCRYITLDAYNKPRVVNFYERNGFIMLRQPKPNHEQAPMYFDLARLPQDNCK